MNIQQKNSAHHFRMQSEREQTLVHSSWFWFLVMASKHHMLVDATTQTLDGGRPRNCKNGV